MNRKLEVGSVLSEVFSIYGAQAGVLLPIAFWLFLAVAIVFGLIAGSLLMLVVAVVISTVASTLYQVVVVELVSDVQDGRRDSPAGDRQRDRQRAAGAARLQRHRLDDHGSDRGPGRLRPLLPPAGDRRDRAARPGRAARAGPGCALDRDAAACRAAAARGPAQRLAP